MKKGIESAKLATASVLSPDSPNLVDGYAMPPLPPPRLHDFEIISPISRGAFGSVFLSRRRQTGDIFAMKVIPASKNEVLYTEREVMCRASHPSVISLYWSFRASGTIFFIMSFARGGDLFALLESVGSLDEETATFYIAELVNAVGYLHSLGIVHCDLKPDNILLNERGHLQLTDFGLSKFGAEQRELSRSLLFRFAPKNETNNFNIFENKKNGKKRVVGTPHYIAPESLVRGDYGPPIDWWAVGAIAYELVVGEPPFNGENEAQIFSAIVNGYYSWPDDVEVSKEYKKMVEDLLQYQPELRPNIIDLKKYDVFKDIDWELLHENPAPFVPDLTDETDLTYFELARNVKSLETEGFEELRAASESKEKPDEWCSTNVIALAELNKDIIASL